MSSPKQKPQELVLNPGKVNTAKSSRDSKRREGALPSLPQMSQTLKAPGHGPQQKTREGVSGAGSLWRLHRRRRGKFGTQSEGENGLVLSDSQGLSR